MSDLNEKRWAVISFRGVEASGLTYDAAMDLRRNLDIDKVYGLCIVTDEAAQREANQVALKNAPPAAPPPDVRKASDPPRGSR